MLNREFKFKLFLSNLYIYKNYYIRIKKLIVFLQKKKRLIYRLKLSPKMINLPGIKKVLLFKAAALQLEKIFYISNGLKLNVNIKNVFTLFSVKNKLQVPKNSIIWWNWRLFFFNDFINILFFSVFFRKSLIFSSFIAKNITDRKMHFNFLKKIRKILNNFFFYGKYYKLIGVLIKVHGKFQGILRKRKFKHAYGKTNLTTINTFVDYSLQKSYTKFGVFSIKVYLFYMD